MRGDRSTLLLGPWDQAASAGITLGRGKGKGCISAPGMGRLVAVFLAGERPSRNLLPPYRQFFLIHFGHSWEFWIFPAVFPSPPWPGSLRQSQTRASSAAKSPWDEAGGWQAPRETPGFPGNVAPVDTFQSSSGTFLLREQTLAWLLGLVPEEHTHLLSSVKAWERQRDGKKQEKQTQKHGAEELGGDFPLRKAPGEPWQSPRDVAKSPPSSTFQKRLL